MTDLLANITAVKNNINRAAEAAGRDPAAITLVAVTKTWPTEVVIAAYEAGLRHFGENRTDEFEAKQADVTAALGAGHDAVWHYIGALQSRQTHTVADYADVFHALDRMKIARRLSQRLVENGRILPVFLEVNVSGEHSKAGFNMSEWEESATQQAQMRKVVESVQALPGLTLQGLMTMAPWGVEKSVIRTVFQRTRDLARWLESEMDGLSLPALSMGMTDDYELAIAVGATHVRVGRALFGERRT